MRFTDLFIRRPVLAIVVNLMILALGLRAMSALPMLQYPRTQNAVITVTTTYYGADPDVIAGFITTPLENAIAQANGIDYMSSKSATGVSTITINLRLNSSADQALTEIDTKVGSVLNQLPKGTQQPVLKVQIGQTIDAMYIGFDSDVLGRNQITDYLTRVVQPRLQAVAGVQTAEILGQQNFALRAWLDSEKLAAYGLSAQDVSAALVQNNYIAGLGTTKGRMVEVNLTASTSLHSAREFADLIVKQADGAIVRLNSATIQGVAAPGVAQSQALDFLRDLAARTLPRGYGVDYSGLSRQYIRRRPASPRPGLGDRRRTFDRHAVHAVRRARHVSDDRSGSFPRARVRRGRARARRGGASNSPHWCRNHDADARKYAAGNRVTFSGPGCAPRGRGSSPRNQPAAVWILERRRSVRRNCPRFRFH
ncbi:MAG: efflux RND transporter permease subunit [Hyphomicrobiales bacterium]|nr:efflux RND transporter permease subunit [Hyphomicrobiales bacterium]